MIFHSIRWRILAWNFGLLATTVTVLLVAFHGHERANRTQAVDLRLRQLMTTSIARAKGLRLLRVEARDIEISYLSGSPIGNGIGRDAIG